MTYEHVVFMQGNEATETLEILDSQGEQAALDHLVQWHYPGEHDASDYTGEGTADSVYVDGIYQMSYNEGLDYIGLIAATEG